MAYGGSLLIKGHVRNDAVAFGGNVQLGPHAVVGGDAVAFGGSVEREPGAKVHGQTLSFGGKSGGLARDRRRARRRPGRPRGTPGRPSSGC